jgi:DNA-binding NarL/FixJ family response regulator
MSEWVNVVIVDDHPLFRSGLRQILENHPRYKIVGEAATGLDALRLINEKKPDIAVLDVNLPELSGLEVVQKLQESHSKTQVIILTMHKEEALLNRALDLGVMAFVLKENAVENILGALDAVTKGEHYLSPSISGFLVERRSRTELLLSKKPGLEDLTKAERRILKLIAENKTSREIAKELFISPRTVEAHRANISGKLGLHGSHSLLQFALENRRALLST